MLNKSPVQSSQDNKGVVEFTAEDKRAYKVSRDKLSAIQALLREVIPDLLGKGSSVHPGSAKFPGQQLRIELGMHKSLEQEALKVSLKKLGVKFQEAFHWYTPFLMIKEDQYELVCRSNGFKDLLRKEYSLQLESKIFDYMKSMFKVDFADFADAFTVHDGSSKFPGKQLRIELHLFKWMEHQALRSALEVLDVNLIEAYHRFTPFLMIKADQYDKTYNRKGFSTLLKTEYATQLALLKKLHPAESSDLDRERKMLTPRQGAIFAENAANVFTAEASYQRGVVAEEKGSLKRAVQFYQLAMKKGHVNACVKMAEFHLQGLADLPKNKQLIYTYFKMAADKGHERAQFNFCMMAERGDGVAKDTDAALSGYRKIVAKGGDYAAKAQARIEKITGDISAQGQDESAVATPISRCA